MAKPNGAVLWEGPSAIDGSPIVAIITGLRSGSANRKTGAMLQTWILPSDVEPHIAIKTGADVAVCGSCPRRPIAAKENGLSPCYVLTQNAPLAIYRSWKRGIYTDLPKISVAKFNTEKPTWAESLIIVESATEHRRTLLQELGHGRAVRLGAWGDPAAIPTWVWAALTSEAKSWTGYTHRWQVADPELAKYCMASADTAWDAHLATERGWRVFRVAGKSNPRTNDPAAAREAGYIICPASDEMGKRTTCERCSLCQGTSVRARSIIIGAHGATKGKG